MSTNTPASPTTVSLDSRAICELAEVAENSHLEAHVMEQQSLTPQVTQRGHRFDELLVERNDEAKSPRLIVSPHSPNDASKLATSSSSFKVPTGTAPKARRTVDANLARRLDLSTESVHSVAEAEGESEFVSAVQRIGSVSQKEPTEYCFQSVSVGNCKQKVTTILRTGSGRNG